MQSAQLPGYRFTVYDNKSIKKYIIDFPYTGLALWVFSLQFLVVVLAAIISCFFLAAGFDAFTVTDPELVSGSHAL